MYQKVPRVELTLQWQEPLKFTLFNVYFTFVEPLRVTLPHHRVTGGTGF